MSGALTIGSSSVLGNRGNVRTPRWIGYLLQRPESHSIHHERGVHAYNYADFAPIDMLFGTFRNPQDFVEECGFWDGASRQVGAMLAGRDVGQPTSVYNPGRSASLST